MSYEILENKPNSCANDWMKTILNEMLHWDTGLYFIEVVTLYSC